MIAAVISLGIAAQITWNSVYKHRFVPKRFLEVDEGTLFRSGQIDAGLIRDVFTENDIQVVLDLNGYHPNMEVDQSAEERISQELGIQHIRIPLKGDGTGAVESYARAIETIYRAHQDEDPILVHCSAGARRTAGVIALYQVLVQGSSTDDAFPQLERYGSNIRESKLLPFLNENMEPIAVSLVDLGVIDRVPRTLPRFDP